MNCPLFFAPVSTVRDFGPLPGPPWPMVQPATRAGSCRAFLQASRSFSIVGPPNRGRGSRPSERVAAAGRCGEAPAAPRDGTVAVDAEPPRIGAPPPASLPVGPQSDPRWGWERSDPSFLRSYAGAAWHGPCRNKSTCPATPRSGWHAPCRGSPRRREARAPPAPAHRPHQELVATVPETRKSSAYTAAFPSGEHRNNLRSPAALPRRCSGSP